MADHEYYVLKKLEEQPDISQREIAAALGVSLGKVNYIIRACIDKGWVKARNFKNNESKMRYAYLLTPKGIVSRTKLAHHFLQRKLDEYDRLHSEIQELEKDLGIKR